MGWPVIVFVGLFLWHEIEEYFVLVPWLDDNTARLPEPVRHINMTRTHFTVIATEELVLLIAVAIWCQPVWIAAIMVVYTIHLVIHCGQLLFTYLKRIPLRLWSAPIQLPIMIWLITITPTCGTVGLPLASLVMVAAMGLNLVAMHWITSKTLKHQ